MNNVKLSINDAPVVKSSSKNREVVVVELKDLTSTGTNGYQYGLSEGSIFEFPNTLEDCQIIGNPVGEKGMDYLILGLKDGQSGWLSFSCLRRKDVNNNFIGEVSQSLSKCSNDLERLKKMVGKTIKGSGSIKYFTAKFDKDGNRTGEMVEKTVTNIEYA
jgi:hypothetical protein